MAFIWENYSLEKFFMSGQKNSPYLEVYPNLRKDVYVNPLIRFSEIFGAPPKLEENNLDISNIENIFFHYLAYLDMLKGMDRKQLKMQCLDNEIKKGFFGEYIKEKWGDIRENHKKIILYILELKMEEVGENNYFFETLKKIFSEISLVYEKNTEIYYLYVHDIKNKYNMIILEVIKFLFWNMTEQIEIVWEKHYGIIGMDNTMKISQISIV